MKILPLLRYVKKYGTAGHATGEQHNTVQAHFMLDT